MQPAIYHHIARMRLVPYKPFEYMYLMTKERRIYAPNRIRELRKAKGLSQEDVIGREPFTVIGRVVFAGHTT